MNLSKKLSSSSVSSPTKVSSNMNKITGMLSLAISEVQRNPSPQKSRCSQSPEKRKSTDSSDCESISQVLENLHRGYLVMKHSDKSDKQSHKFVYVSTDNRFLCWKSVDKEDEKRMELISIRKVIKEGVQFYLKTAKINNLSNCLMIFSDKRNLQVECATQLETQYFKFQLDQAIRYSRNLRFNYKYLKV